MLFVWKISNNLRSDMDEPSCHYDEETIKLKNMFGSKESGFVKELSSKIITEEFQPNIYSPTSSEYLSLPNTSNFSTEDLFPFGNQNTCSVYSEEEEWSEEEEIPYISVTSFKYQQSQETIQTTLELEQSTGPFDLCYKEIYDDKGFIKIDEKTFMLIIKLYEFLENNIYTMLSSELAMILPKKLEIIFNYIKNFETVFTENFKWNGQYFYDRSEEH